MPKSSMLVMLVIAADFGDGGADSMMLEFLDPIYDSSPYFIRLYLLRRFFTHLSKNYATGALLRS